LLWENHPIATILLFPFISSWDYASTVAKADAKLTSLPVHVQLPCWKIPMQPRIAIIISDWVLRGGIALVFILFGVEKFPSHPDGQWVKLFQEIGIGQWFRYLSGVVEILGGLLVLIPPTARTGLALLALTMASAALIVALRLGRPADAIISTLFCLALSAFWWARRNS
jgi:putative oxidoreductase